MTKMKSQDICVVLIFLLIVVLASLLLLLPACNKIPQAVLAFGATQQQIHETLRKAGTLSFGNTDDELIYANIKGLFEQSEAFENMSTEQYYSTLASYGIHPHQLMRHLAEQRMQLETHGLAFSKARAKEHGAAYLAELAQKRKALPLAPESLPALLDSQQLENRHNAMVEQVVAGPQNYNRPTH